MAGPIKLTGYTAVMASKPAPSTGEKQRLAEAAPKRRVEITLLGENFVERAMMLIIKIGNIQVREFSITPDQRTIVCHLDEMPEEGAVISVGYGGERRVELAERFSREKVQPATGGPVA